MSAADYCQNMSIKYCALFYILEISHGISVRWLFLFQQELCSCRCWPSCDGDWTGSSHPSGCQSCRTWHIWYWFVWNKWGLLLYCDELYQSAYMLMCFIFVKLDVNELFTFFLFACVGLRFSVHILPSKVGARPWEGEREWWCHCVGASSWSYRYLWLSLYDGIKSSRPEKQAGGDLKIWLLVSAMFHWFIFVWILGARATATLLHEMKRRGKDCRFGIVSMCIGKIILFLADENLKKFS